MFDTMTITKTGAGLAGALLLFLFASWGAEALYSTEAESHGEGEEAHAMGYEIEVAEASSADAEPEVEVPFSEVFAAADPAAGEREWSKCRSCHALEQGQNGTGPSLYGVVGHPIGAVDGFSYSDAVASHGGEWTPENLNAWLTNPREFIPGNRMSFAGISDVEDRANLIAYLATIGE